MSVFPILSLLVVVFLLCRIETNQHQVLYFCCQVFNLLQSGTRPFTVFLDLGILNEHRPGTSPNVSLWGWSRDPSPTGEGCDFWQECHTSVGVSFSLRPFVRHMPLVVPVLVMLTLITRLGGIYLVSPL